jgi:hypothetical protein
MLVCMALVAFPLRRTIRGARVVALVLPVHLLLDGMWVSDMRVSLLWPWAGSAFPPLHEVGVPGLWAHLARDLSDPVNLAGELGGLLVLAYLWHTGAFVPLPTASKAKETLG